MIFQAFRAQALLRTVVTSRGYIASQTVCKKQDRGFALECSEGHAPSHAQRSNVRASTQD